MSKETDLLKSLCQQTQLEIARIIAKGKIAWWRVSVHLFPPKADRYPLGRNDPRDSYGGRGVD